MSNFPPHSQYPPGYVPPLQQLVRSTQPGEIPPGRVQVALEYLMLTSSKTMTRAAVSDNAIQLIDGQVLTTAEANTQATACNVLNEYLLGKLKPTYWERIPKERISYDVPDQHECPSDEGRPPFPSMFIRCFACAGSSNDQCQFCLGTGHLIITPTPGGEK